MNRKLRLEREIHFLNNYKLRKAITTFLQERYEIDTKLGEDEGKVALRLEGVKASDLQTSTVLEKLQTSLTEQGFVFETEQAGEMLVFITESEKKQLELDIIELVQQKKKIDNEIRELAKDKTKRIDDEDVKEKFELANSLNSEIIKKQDKLAALKEAREIVKGEKEAAKVQVKVQEIEVNFKELMKEELEKIKANLEENDLEMAIEDFAEEQKNLKKDYFTYLILSESAKVPTNLYPLLKYYIRQTTTKFEESSESNVILDKKFIWLFNIFGKDGEEIDSYIDDIDEAIDIAVKKQAQMIIANPYIDPNPEDEDVELVFVDEIGPVKVYDGEEVTVEKEELEKEGEE